MRYHNYDKSPFIPAEGKLYKGWKQISETLKHKLTEMGRKKLTVVECYPGTYMDEIGRNLRQMGFDNVVDMANLYKPEAQIRSITEPWVTDDMLFGKKSPLSFDDFIDIGKVDLLRRELLSANTTTTAVYGTGAAYVCPDADLLVYADMPRWEIQQRQRRHDITALGVDNSDEQPSQQYKRGYFVDWDICDALKKDILPRVHYWMDTCTRDEPKMIEGGTLRHALVDAAHRPFRVVPFFDPAPWGGQWMKEVCGLNPDVENYGWCFDCVPEENSLYLRVQGENFEIPANNVVFYQTKELLGNAVAKRFGEFPIRFDFLDTMGGGNLSLQVHPTPSYISRTFGMPYTQDESYYLLNADKGATVYLGLKTGVRPDEMIAALYQAQETSTPFDAERYVNRWEAHKHDHFLIPGGTVHCSGAGALVLEISATPSIFTFKLYDWGRMGLDGRPRPINIRHGSNVIQWERQTDMIRKSFINHVEKVGEGDGWEEERTGLHELEFIETRRHHFTKAVPHDTCDGVNVLNLVEGSAAVVESADGRFAPFTVHYAETFIVPASAGKYSIRPLDPSGTEQCATIKASIRNK
jgi:mannose-6-phosphate isomerase class I